MSTEVCEGVSATSLLPRQSEISAIHLVCHSPSPYNDHLFSTLNEALDVPLTVHYLYETSQEHYWRTRLRRGYRSRIYSRRLCLDWTLIRQVLGDPRSLFVTACWQDLTSQLLMLCCIAARRRYVVWNDTPSPFKKRHAVKALLRRLFLSFVLSRAFAVLGTGRPALKAIKELGARAETLRCLPCFVDLTLFRPGQGRGKRSPVVFVSCARLHPEKGLDIALRALAFVRSRFFTPFTYKIAGDGPEAGRLKKLAAELGISDSVQFLGWLEPSVLPEFYRSADVFLHPARFEPYGVAVLEAMASGLIVVASSQTVAALDRIQQGENGYLYQSEDPLSLAETIFHVLNLPVEDSLRMEHEARMTAEHWPAGRAIDVFNELTRNGGRAA